MKLFFYFILLLCVIFGCRNSNEQMESNASEIAKTVCTFDEDSIKNGPCISFFDNGDTASIFYYKNDLKDSISKTYYPSGSLMSLRYWKMGDPWGEYITYYDSLIDRYYTRIGDDTVEVEEPLKKSYAVFGLDGKIKYQRKYDQEGEVTEVSGSSILFSKIEAIEISIHDTLSIQYYLASPDWVDRFFKVIIRSQNGKLLTSELQTIDNKYNAVFYQRTFENPGSYIILGISRFTDQLNEISRTDTSRIEIQVTSNSKPI